MISTDNSEQPGSRSRVYLLAEELEVRIPDDINAIG
jgi:hypothetical protein